VSFRTERQFFYRKMAAVLFCNALWHDLPRLSCQLGTAIWLVRRAVLVASAQAFSAICRVCYGKSAVVVFGDAG
jgi:hypothetical protein